MKRLTYFCPRETTARLRCPERGFYSILRFTAEEDPVVPKDFPRHPDDTLILVEINLAEYSGGSLTERALNGISGLFKMLRGTGCGLIVRFLYDWCGKNMITEPKRIDIILGHMEQLGTVIRENSDFIFLLQGLFVGNWGEMHGSRFIRTDHLKRLYSALSRAAGGKVQTAVRTPAIWRSVTGTAMIPEIKWDGSLPGLFNDAMLGNESEYGTFSQDPDMRTRELSIQEKLSLFVPYGGEVVGTAPQSDAERAMAAFEKTRVSYLNRLYDEKTLAKWKNTAVTDGSIWNGMSYFDYAEAHMGYRFVIRGVRLRCSARSGTMTAKIQIENTGFAPIYHNTAAELIFVSGKRKIIFPLTGGVRGLLRTSGTGCLTAKLAVPGESLGGETYEIFFRLKSLKYNVTVPTANQGNCETGCLIGRYTVQ